MAYDDPRKSEYPSSRKEDVKDAPVTPAGLVAGLKLFNSSATDAETEDTPYNPSFMWKLIHLDPALFRGLVLSIVLLLGAFGLFISDHERDSIVGVIFALLPIMQSLWTRTGVTANHKVVVYKPDPVNAPTEVAAGPAVSTDGVAVLKAANENSNGNYISSDEIDNLPVEV